VTPREELIQAIERSPDGVVQELLDMLKALQNQSTESTHALQHKKVSRKQGVLVREAGESSEFKTD
jgi:predicted glycosyltransferase